MTAERITVTDARRAGFCVSGIRSWFRAKDADFADFLKNGIDPTDERWSGDAQIQRILATKRKSG